MKHIPAKAAVRIAGSTIEVEAVRSTPEEQLWLAVVERSIRDFKEMLRLARRAKSQNRPHPRHLDYNFTSFKYEITSEWFEYICDMAQISHSMILRYVNEQATLHGFNETKAVRGIDAPRRPH